MAETILVYSNIQNDECSFTIIECKYCNKYKSMRYLIGKLHENTCDEVAIECKNGCGVKLFRKEMQLHLLNDCVEQPQKCMSIVQIYIEYNIL